jgi:hypothetical protein
MAAVYISGDIDHSCVPIPCSKKKNLQIAGTKKICLQNVENSSMGIVPFFACGIQVLALSSNLCKRTKSILLVVSRVTIGFHNLGLDQL